MLLLSKSSRAEINVIYELWQITVLIVADYRGPNIGGSSPLGPTKSAPMGDAGSIVGNPSDLVQYR